LNRRFLIGYQLLTGLQDALTGLLLIFDPSLTLRLMRLQASPDALPFLSFIGAFVLSVGIACLYGAILAARAASAPKLEAVWLLTAITRGLVAIFVAANILSGSLESGWVTVAISDGLFALVQSIGLAKDWIADARP
jgi:hypothetical protein